MSEGPFTDATFNRADAARNVALRDDPNDLIGALRAAYDVVRQETAAGLGISPALARAIDNVLAAAHGPRFALTPPWNAPLVAGLNRYGDVPLFDLWVLLGRVDALHIAWTGKPSVMGSAVELPAPDASSDEAPGLDVPVESAEPGADQQPRLPR